MQFHPKPGDQYSGLLNHSKNLVAVLPISMVPENMISAIMTGTKLQYELEASNNIICEKKNEIDKMERLDFFLLRNSQVNAINRN